MYVCIYIYTCMPGMPQGIKFSGNKESNGKTELEVQTGFM